MTTIGALLLLVPAMPTNTALRTLFARASSRSSQISLLIVSCTHGGTQNTNESFHNLVWERCPRTAFVGRRRLELAVYEATIVYNEGEMARMPVFSKLGFQPGGYTASGLKELDEKRVARAYVAGSATVLAQRQRRSVQSSSQRDDSAYISSGFYVR